jgi:predicted TIM-barrel fold metal-dependent hydrolase
LRNGFKIFDADTHIRPSAESLRPHLSAKVLERIPDLEEHRVPIKVGMAGEVREEPYRHWYRFRGGEGGGWGSRKPRYLGEASPREDEEREFQTFMGSRFPTEGGGDYDPRARLLDMDEEGVDVHFIVNGGGAGHKDPEMELEFIRAQHRYLDQFCSADPHRLKTCLTVTPEHLEGSVEEIRRWGKTDWCVAIHPKLPLDYPIDHPDMYPIWAAAQEENLAVIHHSNSSGYPGYRDLWDNPFLGRLAAHPWGAMRAVGAVFGSGMMDRFPNLRYGILESGFGWLPFWAKRMDDQVVYMGYVNEHLEYKLSEYLTGGRFFTGIVLHEGEDMVKMVTDQLGDHVLMFGSDYPHAESRFPTSANIPLGWKSLTDEQRRKLLWDNPVGFFGEP